MIAILTQFEWIKSELKRIFHELNKISGKLIIIENVFFNLNRAVYVFQTERQSDWGSRWWIGSRFTDSDAILELQQRRRSRPLVDVVYRRDDGDHVVEKKKIILFYYLRNSQITGFPYGSLWCALPKRLVHIYREKNSPPPCQLAIWY